MAYRRLVSCLEQTFERCVCFFCEHSRQESSGKVENSKHVIYYLQLAGCKSQNPKMAKTPKMEETFERCERFFLRAL